jgi:hypothetical protein
MANRSAVIEQLKAERELVHKEVQRIDAALAALGSGSSKRTISAASRRKMAAAQRTRWAKVKRATSEVVGHIADRLGTHLLELFRCICVDTRQYRETLEGS